MVIGLVLVVLVSAFRRLELYEEAYGFTWPRLLGHLAVLILAALLSDSGDRTCEITRTRKKDGVV